ncbi:MAG TPA: peptide deformylase [Cyclobacteriaceae bacterium]
MIYPIVLYGHPVLRKKAREIDKNEADVKKLSEDMFETMQAASGIGLAAPQIGMDLRIFVVDGTSLSDEDMKDFKKVFVNPVIIEEHGEDWNFEEGCLSIPGIREDVSRNAELKLKYYDEEWKLHEDVFKGMQARVIQHEYDHIEGILFTDHLGSFKKRILKGKLTNISKGKVDVDYRVIAPLVKK